MPTEGRAISKLINGGELQVSWKLLNQNYINNTSNIYFEAKIKTENDSISSSFPYWVNLSAAVDTDGTLERIYGAEGEYTSFKIPAETEYIFYTSVENIQHFDRVHNQKFVFQYSLTGMRGEHGEPGVIAKVIGEVAPTTSTIELFDAPDFDDESDLTITYTYNIAANFKNVQFGIATSPDNHSAPVIAYRDVALNGNTYTFEFTETERNTLRAITTEEVRELYIVSRGIYQDDSIIENIYLHGKVNFYVKGEAPIIHSISIQDINEKTVALTGNKLIFVDGYSQLKYNIEAVAQKYALIDAYEVALAVSGTNQPYNLKKLESASGAFLFDTEGYKTSFNNFYFKITDSRHDFAEEYVAYHNIIDYIKPTCTHNISIAMSEEDTTKGIARLIIAGYWWSGSFGAKDNTLKLEVRHTQNDGSMGDWVTLTDVLIPIITDTENTALKHYELTTNISGFEHNGTYTFECRIIDELEEVYSEASTVRITPVFDWGENDFRFNVPVAINGELRASSLVLNNEPIADYIIEYGNDGNYFYRKWAGGTLEAWRVAKSTVKADASITYGSMFYTTDLEVATTGDASQFTQVDNVQITINRAGAFGMWLAVVKDWEVNQGEARITYALLNATDTEAYIMPCVYIIGRWN